MLNDLCGDTQGVLLQKLDQPSLIMLLYVNKKYYDIVSTYGKINNLGRKLECPQLLVMDI
jgi:hypothetical protein